MQMTKMMICPFSPEVVVTASETMSVDELGLKIFSVAVEKAAFQAKAQAQLYLSKVIHQARWEQ